jgi:galactokinase/mevalonate kinase-like predicted kinase
VSRRQTIANHQKKLQQKLTEYKNLCEEFMRAGSIKNVEQFFKEDISELQKIIENGVNYRMSQNAFNEDIDNLIYKTLLKVGNIECVDVVDF